MPIEFYCPGCGNLMRTPDETAGRKGRCPTCQLKVQIPANSVAATSSESAVPRSAIAAIPKAKGPEPIRFDCGSCGKTLSIPATNAGKKGQCPHCGELMSIPLKSPAAGERWKGTPQNKSKTSSAKTSKPASTPQPTLTKAGGDKIEFHCSSCREVVRVGAAAAGKKGQCPRCKAVIQIPLKSTSVSGLQPIPSDQAKPSPRPQRKPATPTPGLTPLPNQSPPKSGLTPLPSLSPAASGLTPLDGLDALSPLEPLGLTPLGSVASVSSNDFLGGDLSGLGSIGDGNPFGNDSNTYSAPRLTPAITRQSRRTGEQNGAQIATMICGGCLTAYGAVHIVIIIFVLFLHSAASVVGLQRMREQSGDIGLEIGIGLSQTFVFVIYGSMMLTILAGGIQMIRFKVWGLCLAACILTMMPCSYLCFLGLPIGIWGIVMLSLDSVRSAFHW